MRASKRSLLLYLTASAAQCCRGFVSSFAPTTAQIGPQTSYVRHTTQPLRSQRPLQCVSCHKQRRRAQTLLAARKRAPKLSDDEDDPLGMEEERDDDTADVDVDADDDDDDDDADADADVNADADDTVTAKGLSLDDIADAAGLVSDSLAASIAFASDARQLRLA
jgi:hypothetical protein